MERLVPLTKILMTLAVSVWAILLRDWASLLALVVVELGVLFVAGLLFKQHKAVLALTSFAVFLGVIQIPRQRRRNICHRIRLAYACDDTCIHLLVGNYKIARPYSSTRNTMQNSL